LVRDLKAGDHFGELALIKADKRSLTVRVKSPYCKLLYLNSEGFTRLLGNIDKFLKKDYNGIFDKQF
jgi:CRP-like cAMP-binding protein